MLANHSRHISNCTKENFFSKLKRIVDKNLSFDWSCEVVKLILKENAILRALAAVNVLFV
jgi:hypothetical protein